MRTNRAMRTQTALLLLVVLLLAGGGAALAPLAYHVYLPLTMHDWQAGM
jgi:hypothetical protein